MRTQLQRRLSFLLAVVMVAALLCVPSFAAGNTAPNEYGITNYVALGDSIATGLNDNNGTNEDAYGSWEVGYTTLLAGRLGLLDGAESYVPEGYDMPYYTSPNASGFHSWAFPAMRTREILHQVDASYNYEMDDFAYLWLDNGELNERLGDVGAMIRADVAKADLITLNIGSNDVLLSQLRITAWELDDPDNGLTSNMIVDLMKSKLGFGDAPTLPEGVDENALVAKFIPRFLANVMKGYNEFLGNMPKIIKALRAQNPTAQIVILGIFNPLHYSLSLTDGKLPVSLGEMLDGVMTPMNAALAADCALYGCTYVDVVDVRTDSSMHPDNGGYQEIADRIVAKLKNAKVKTVFSDTQNLSEEFKTAINWAVETGVTEGTSETTFSPNDTCTRAQIATFLWRMAGEPEPTTAAAFEDVKADDYFAKAVAWAAENGITNGTSDTKFSPDAKCTRAQIVTFLYRFDQKFNPDATQGSGKTDFTDVSPLAYYGAPVAWAVKNGITKGISSVLFAPLQSCTRAQAVTFLYRYRNL